MTKNLGLILGILIVIVGGYFLVRTQTVSVPSYNNGLPATTTDVVSTTTTPVVPPIGTTTPSTGVTYLPYGNVSLSLGEKAIFPEGYLKITSVTEDSRCPQDVQCIQAGTVKVDIEYTEKGVMKKINLGLDKSFTRGGEKIAFVSVMPNKTAGKVITNSDYRFTLNVTKNTSPVATGGCYIGGCSSEICSSEQGVVSNCIYKSEFACYKTAKCERQASGQCGWTSTNSLNSCLANAR